MAKSAQQEPKMGTVHFRLPEDDLMELRRLAAAKKTSVSELVRRAMRQVLESGRNSTSEELRGAETGLT